MKKTVLLLLAVACGIMCAACALGAVRAVARHDVVEAILASALAVAFGTVTRVAWRAVHPRTEQPRAPYTPGGTLFDD